MNIISRDSKKIAVNLELEDKEDYIKNTFIKKNFPHKISYRLMTHQNQTLVTSANISLTKLKTEVKNRIKPIKRFLRSYQMV